MTDGNVKIKASLDDSDYARGIRKLVSDLDVAEAKLKEFNIEGKRGSSILDSLGLGAVALGGSLVAAMSAGVASSPQFKQFLGELAPSLFELSDFIGGKFSDVFDKAIPLVEDLVGRFTTSEVTNTVFDTLANSLQNSIDLVNELISLWDSLPESVRNLITTGGSQAAETLVNPSSLITNAPERINDTAFAVGGLMGMSKGEVDTLMRPTNLVLEMGADVLKGDTGELRRDAKELADIITKTFMQKMKLLGIG